MALWTTRIGGAGEAVVAAVLEDRPGLQVLSVRTDRGGTKVGEGRHGGDRIAVCFPLLTGMARVGDRVLLNTTAVDLGLGSGGYDFVMAVWRDRTQNDDADGLAETQRKGHIMKLRYTPAQVACLAVEEEDSPYHETVAAVRSLDGMPVLIGGVHSLVAPLAVAAALASESLGRGIRVAYVMTDGAALPLPWSNTVRRLRELGLLCGTVTCGHAFGGDLEAVTFHSALAACYSVLRADAVIVAMGPGLVGTGTRLGHTALEVGELVDAVNALGGEAIAVPRISVADPRTRHRGISHHFLTALNEVANTPATIILPEIDYVNVNELVTQLDEAGLTKPGRWRPYAHRLLFRKPPPDVPDRLQELDLDARFMGRSPAEEPAFFATAAAAGVYAAERALKGRMAGRE